MQKKILIVDDSVAIRNYMKSIIETDNRLEVIGLAANPFEAVDIMSAQKPDLILLDIEMPRMDGLSFLQKIMAQHPIPVVILTQLDAKIIKNMVSAMHVGQVEVFEKRFISIASPENISFFLDALFMACETASLQLSEPVSDCKIPTSLLDKNVKEKLILIGASTGGTNVLLQILKEVTLPAPPIIIVQHMPIGFTNLFATQLNKIIDLEVVEATHNVVIEPSKVYIAKGGFHLTVDSTEIGSMLKLTQGDAVNYVKPSIDQLFFSAIHFQPKKLLAILLTGMGSDGALGLKKLHDIGVFTVAQNRESCAVYGMPRAAVELNAVSCVMSPEEIRDLIKKM